MAFGVPGNGAGAAADRPVGSCGPGPGLSPTVSGDPTNGTGLGDDPCSPPEGAGLLAALAVAGVEPTKLAAGNEVDDGLDTCLGRRGGGGAGAWRFTRRLDERERVESCDDRRMDDASSVEVASGMVNAFVATESLLSVRE